MNWRKKLRKKAYRWLRWSEQYTGTDMVYLFKGMSWSTLGQAVSTVAGFVLAVALGNLLPKEAYGTYKYVLSLTGLFFFFTLPKFNTALKKAVAEGYEGDILPVVKTRMKWATIGAFGNLCVGGYYLYMGNLELSIAFLIAAMVFPFMQPTGVFGAVFEGRKDFKNSTIYKIITRSFSLAAMVATAFLTNNPIWIVVAYFIPTTIAHTGLLIYMLYTHDFNDKKQGDVYNYGKHLTVMDAINSAASQLDNLLMWHLLGPAALATYNFAIAPVDQAKRLLKSLNNIAFPKFAEKDIEILQQTLEKKVLKFLGLAIFFAIVYAIAAPWFYKLLFPQYMDSVLFSRIYALGFIFVPLSMFGVVQSAQANKKALYVAKIATPIIKILALITLIPILGILGAVIALLGTSAVHDGILYYYFRKE